MVSQGHAEGKFSVYPEDLVKELVIFRSNLQRILDYNSIKLPLLFSQVLRLLLCEIFSNLNFQTAGLCIVFWGILGLISLDGAQINNTVVLPNLLKVKSEAKIPLNLL